MTYENHDDPEGKVLKGLSGYTS